MQEHLIKDHAAGRHVGGITLEFEATVFRSLVASPNDTQDERRIVPVVLHRWNHEHSGRKDIVLLPVRWETDAYASYEP